jgi:hypothetical protein
MSRGAVHFKAVVAAIRRPHLHPPASQLSIDSGVFPILLKAI